MKKQLILFSLILAMFTAYAQDQQTADTAKKVKDSTICHHRINLHLGGAFTNNLYAQSPEVYRKNSGSMSFEFSYAYFFNKTVGLGLGVGFDHLSANLKTNISGIVPGNQYPQQEDHVYDLLYSTNDLMEHQSISSIYVPLTVQFEHKFKNGKNGIYGDVGVVGYFPLVAKSKLKKGELVTRGYEEYLNVLYQNDMPQHGLTTSNFNGTNKLYNNKSGLRCSVGLTADFGGIFEINNKVDFYVGLYMSAYFLDILPKAENHHTYLEVDPSANVENKVVYNGLLGSNYVANYNTQNNADLREAFKLHEIGLKLGIHIKPCGKVNKSLKKQYYEEMIKRANDPINDKGKDDDANGKKKGNGDDQRPVEKTEIIYIIPQCDAPAYNDNNGKNVKNANDDNNNSQMSSPLIGKASNKDNENLNDLVDVLSVTKILFDLDKDDPKVAKKDEDNINKVASILKNDPSLILIVEGYTCPLGSKEHNQALAKRRANNTRDYFISKGVPADQIETYSYIADDDASVRNISSSSNEEHRAAIFRIRKR